ncbi:preprotein translocase subunit SecG [Bifidobacterium felsineum]|uniref:preprotein translocase subunit SecG n=1 Tax=Bifidobacterium felsineum TaxID=2045440 RepID=UPI001BDD6090|nr:preprotein translocase subunit SecG [Bifidobacterium felsineum]MBT1164598.1 preprotein translocase subunit SecG [Bifidobacterium felsineum]
MTILTIILKTISVVCALLLTLLILMHKGKGGGFTDSFDMLTGNAGSSGVAERNLNRWTILTALVWVATILALDLI